MKQSEKASIFRIVTDLIKADSIIDTREIEKLDSIRERFAIKKEDEMLGFSYTFANAIRVLLDPLRVCNANWQRFLMNLQCQTIFVQGKRPCCY